MRKLRKNYVTVDNTVEAYLCVCHCWCRCACPVTQPAVHAGVLFGLEANVSNSAVNVARRG